MATTAAPPFIKAEPPVSHVGGMSPPKSTVTAPGTTASEVPSLTITQSGSSSTSTTNQPNSTGVSKFTENSVPAPLPTIEQTPTRFLQACSKLDLEPNPFEQSFGGLPAGDTPGNTSPTKPVLPPVASIASPSLNVPPTVNETFNWDSLRAGPLSPSMLQGPTNPSDFNTFSRPGEFPPYPPNMSNAMYVNSTAPVPSLPISSAVPTNTTAATATTASADSFKPFYHQQMPRPLTVNERAKIVTGPNGVPPQQNSLLGVTTSQPMFNSMPPNGAGPTANGGGSGNNLYLLSQAQQEVMRRGSGVGVNGTMMIKSEKDDFVNASPATQQARGIKRPASNGNGNVTYGHGKTPSSSPPGSNGSPLGNGGVRNTRQRTMSVESNSDDESPNKKMSKMPKDMDDEEKRKNFLERNRQAALKCRQRKKAWLANLQAKVDYLANENETLQSHATSLKEEIINLKTLLLAHKDCPIAQANGVMIDAIGSRNGSGAPVTIGNALQGLNSSAGMPPGMVPVSAGMGMSNGNGISPMGPPMGPGGQMMRY